MTLTIEKTLTSLEVAEMVEKNHKDVLRDIRNITTHLGESKIAPGTYFIESTYLDANNQSRPSFLLTKKGCELFSTRMTGAKGTQFAVAYIDRFNQMEEHIKENEIDYSKVSPSMLALKDMIDNMARQEIEQQKQKEKIDLLEKRQENISDTLLTNSDDWRVYSNKVIRSVAHVKGGNHLIREVRLESYIHLEDRARCNLEQRLQNLKGRLYNQGKTSSYVSKINKLDVIEADNKLIEIYLQIIKELAIKYNV